MALIKRVYTDEETIITAKNLNDIQDAVLALEDGLFVAEDSKSGTAITITDASKRSFSGFSIYGKTTQNGTPTPDAPVELVNIGKGSITVNVAGEKASQSMTIATPNGLPGIPVATGGNYTDANGQQWICDEIDLARGVYIKRTNRLSLDGSENWGLYSFQNQYYGFALYNALDAILARANGLCNQFAVGKDADNVVWLGVSNTGLYVITSEWHSKGMAAWKEHLAANPLTVIYPSATTTETALTEEELVAYAALHTYKDSTTVSNDAGAWMDVEYILDAKKYIDKIVVPGGTGGGAAPARLSYATLRASAWKGADSLYSQVVTIDGVTEYSKVDLLPSVEQLAIFHNKDVAFVTENEDGVVTVYAIGEKPTNDYTMQVSITEVVV